MSEKFYLVKEYFDNGFWDEARVNMAVEKEWISEEEAEKILRGED